MVVAFNMGATANSGATWMWLDNIGLEEVPSCPPEDLSSDCLVDMEDLAIVAATWLDCNREPSAECWK
jgi:hypothetical protein